MKKKFSYLFLITFIFLTISASAQFNKSSLPDMQIGLSANAYYAQCNFANAIDCDERGWASASTGNRSTRVGVYNADGYPKWLPDTTVIYPKGTPFIVYPGQNADAGRNGLYRGVFCVSWIGEADVQLTGATFLSSSPSANNSTGMMVNGKRYYIIGQASEPAGVKCSIREINPSNPPTKVRMWMPDPTDPFNKSLEPAVGQAEPTIHPALLDKLNNPAFGTIRFMDWMNTNTNPLIYWKERRKPSCSSQCSENFTPRIVPGGQATTYYGAAPVSGNAGVSYEYMIDMCNKLNKDAWINVPHAATNGYVDSLAMLCAGLDPDGTGCPGLNSNLRVHLEYSNEIWTPCDSHVRSGYFTQGCYADDQRVAYNLAHGTSLTREQWIARRFCEVWSIFKNRFVDVNRIVNVLALWTVASTYSSAVAAEAVAYGPTLSPAVHPDVLACTSYFGNGIEQYIFEKSPWKNGTATTAALDTVFREWKYRILGEEASSNGKDYQGGGGGFGTAMTVISKQYHIPLVSYEGGMSLGSDYSTYIDVPNQKIVTSSTPGAVFCFQFGNNATDTCYLYSNGGAKGTGRIKFSDFIKSVQRDQRYGEMYYLNTMLAKAKGMYTPSQYGSTGAAGGVYGMWGVWESLDQVNTTAPKYNGLTKFYNEYKNLREVDDSIGTRPSFAAAGELFPATEGVSYNTDLICTNGERTIRMDAVGDLPKGISLIYGTRKVTVAGTPLETGTFRFAVRAIDDDNDYTLRIFTLTVLGAPKNTAFATDDFGQSKGIKLDSLNTTGTGWKDKWRIPGGTWIIPNRVPADTVWTIQNQTPFTYAALKTSGTSYAKMGFSGQVANRPFDLTKCPNLVSANNSTYIGQTGTTLWFSTLIRTKLPITSGDPIIRFASAGGSSQNIKYQLLDLRVSNGKWTLGIKNNATTDAATTFTTLESTKALVDGQTDLVVMAVDFQQPYDRVRLYLNPSSIGTIAPTTPDLIFNLTSADADMLFSHFTVYGSQNSNKIWMDDVRFGETYAAVTPTAVNDTQAPSIPGGLTFAKATNDTLSLTWNASTDNIGVAGYKIYKNSQLYVTVAQPNLMLINPPVSELMKFKIMALDYAGNASDTSAVAQITLADSKAPSVPNGLNATNKWSNRFTINWVAASDNVGVTSYEVYNNGISVGTTSGTSMEVINLAASTSYPMTVNAKDTLGNTSAASDILDVFTLDADVDEPTVPSTLTILNLDYTSFTLKWTASTDNVAIEKYYIYLNGVLKDSTISTSISLQNLTQNKTYYVTVKAKDTSCNLSAAGTINATTLADITSPTAPTGLSYSNIATTSFTLLWGASTDNVALSKYYIYKNGVLNDSTNNLTINTVGLTSGQTYTMTVKAKDMAGNYSSEALITVQTTPSATTKLTVNPVQDTDTRDALGTAASIYTGATGNNIYMKFDLTGLNVTVFTAKLKLYHAFAKTTYTLSAATTSNTNWIEGGTKPSAGTSIASVSMSGAIGYDSLDVSTYVQSQMNAGKIVSIAISNDLGADMSYYSRESTTFKPQLVMTTAPIVNADAQEPTTPSTLTKSLVHGNDFTLSWTASTDNVAVTSYDVYKNAVFYGSTSTTSLLVSGLTAATNYSMTVKAKDASNNVSATSAALDVLTLDNVAPSAPSSLTTTSKSFNDFILSWTEATDNVGLTAYDVYKNGVLYGSTATNSLSVSGLTSGVTYTMTVKAKDEAGNISSASLGLNVQTLDNIAPNAPTSLVSSSKDNVSFVLGWTAPTDNVGVTGYDVYKDGVLYGSTTSKSMIINGLTAGLTYSMTVKAKDAAANISAESAYSDETIPFSSTSTTVNPIADTNSTGDVTAGTNTTLACSKTVVIYEKFDLSAFTGNLSSAKLRIYEASTRTGGYTLTVSTTSNDTWVEGGTKPSKGTSITTAVMAGTIGYIEIDLTNHVISKLAGNKIISVAFTTSVTSSITFNSRQNAANKPELVLVSLPADNQAPTRPSGLSTSSVSLSGFNLNWSASTDNVGVVRYDVYKDAAFYASTTNTSISVANLQAQITYRMTVKAIDAAGYSSATSQFLDVTTDTSTKIQNPKEIPIVLYPNPVGNILFIQLNAEKEVIVTITDLNGRILKIEERKLSPDGFMSTNLSGYEPGIYLIKVQYLDKILNGKFLKK